MRMYKNFTIYNSLDLPNDLLTPYPLLTPFVGSDFKNKLHTFYNNMDFIDTNLNLIKNKVSLIISLNYWMCDRYQAISSEINELFKTTNWQDEVSNTNTNSQTTNNTQTSDATNTSNDKNNSQTAITNDNSGPLTINARDGLNQINTANTINKVFTINDLTSSNHSNLVNNGTLNLQGKNTTISKNLAKQILNIMNLTNLDLRTEFLKAFSNLYDTKNIWKQRSWRYFS